MFLVRHPILGRTSAVVVAVPPNPDRCSTGRDRIITFGEFSGGTDEIDLRDNYAFGDISEALEVVVA